MEANKVSTESATMILKQVIASLFFGISSILIVMVNKIVLTTYKFVLTTKLCSEVTFYLIIGSLHFKFLGWGRFVGNVATFSVAGHKVF